MILQDNSIILGKEKDGLNLISDIIYADIIYKDYRSFKDLNENDFVDEIKKLTSILKEKGVMLLLIPTKNYLELNKLLFDNLNGYFINTLVLLNNMNKHYSLSIISKDNAINNQIILNLSNYNKLNNIELNIDYDLNENFLLENIGSYIINGILDNYEKANVIIMGITLDIIPGDILRSIKNNNKEQLFYLIAEHYDYSEKLKREAVFNFNSLSIISIS